MFLMVLRRLSCVFLLWIGMSGMAHASTFPGPYLSFFGQLFAIQGEFTVSTGSLLSQNNYAFSDTLTAPDSAYATMSASIQFGVMEMFTQAFAPGCFACTSPEIAADLQYGDTITPLSGDVAPGTLEPFQFTENIRYSAASAPSPQNGVDGGGGVYVNDWPCSFGNNFGNCQPNEQLWSVFDGGSSGGFVTFTSTQVVDLPVGQAGYFVQDFYSQIGTSAGTDTFNASDTAWLNITSLNPDVTFSTGSRFNYSENPESAAPEPPAVWLLLTLAMAACIGHCARREETNSAKS